MLNDFLEFIRDEEKRPSLSNILFLLCGFIGILCAFSLISPFHFSTAILDKVSWKGSLSDKDLIVQMSIGVLVLRVLVYIIKEVGIHVFQEKLENQLRLIYATLYTISDIADLASSIILLFFIIAVFVQVYKTRIMFASFKACCIYVVIGVRFFAFLWYRFRARNLKIIDRVLQKSDDN